MTGFESRSSSPSQRASLLASARRSASGRAAWLCWYLKSPPEQNALPAPVSTTTRTAGSLSIRATSARASSYIVPFMAFFASGRFRHRVATPSGRSA